MQDHPALDHPTMLNSFQGTDEVRKQETLSKQEKLSIYMQSHPPEFKIFPVQKGFYAPESSETSRNHGLKGKRFPGYE